MNKTSTIIPDGGEIMATKRSISQAKCHAKTFTRYTVAFHNINDKEVIEYIENGKAEGKSAAQVIRDLYKAVIK